MNCWGERDGRTYLPDFPEPGRVWVVAATALEMEACFPGKSHDLLSPPFWRESEGRILCLSGLGTPLALSRLIPLVLGVRPRLLLNIGIAGAYAESGLRIGDLVLGESDAYGDIGYETSEEAAMFTPFPDELLAQSGDGGKTYASSFPLHCPSEWLLKGHGRATASLGKGLTVNTCTGTRRTGTMRRRLFGADFETQEGAAIAHIGQLYGFPVVELRAISNFASTRDMQKANVNRALTNLRGYIEALVAEGLC